MGETSTAAIPEPTSAVAASRPLVIFALEGQRFALDLPCVQRSLRVVAITPLPGAPAVVLGIVDLAGAVIPVVDIRRRFGHPPRPLRLSDHLLIARAGERTVALLVDETCGVLEAPEAARLDASEILPHLELVQGVVKLDDGLVLIHDLERLLSLDEAAALDCALQDRANEQCDPKAAPAPEAP